MNRSHAFPSKYLSKTDVEGGPVLAVVGSVMGEDIKGEHGDDHKPVCYFTNLEKGLILNGINWDTIQDIATKNGVAMPEDSDNWTGQKVVLYFDPTVRFGSKVTGGLRVRAPIVKTQAAPPAEPEEMEPPPLADEDIAF